MPSVPHKETFYETATDRDTRLVRAVAVTDVDWLTRFVHWLRTDANHPAVAESDRCE